MDWNYNLGDAKVVSAKKFPNEFILDLDCSWTDLHPTNYIKRLKFMNYEIVEEDRDITGLFWYREELTFNGQQYRLRVKFIDNKNHKRFFCIFFKNVEVCKE